MPCLAALLAVFFPRLVIALVFVFSRYLEQAYDTWYWPVLGFVFMPFTTLAYAFALNHGQGLIGVHLAVFVIAVLMDIGALSGGGYASRRG